MKKIMVSIAVMVISLFLAPPVFANPMPYEPETRPWIVVLVVTGGFVLLLSIIVLVRRLNNR